MKSIISASLCFLLIATCSCNSFRYGYTQKQALNSYNLITNSPSNFGDRRVRYNIGHHANSQLAYFLKNRGKPHFIFEYEDDKRKDGINLYYVDVDSAYLFKEKKAGSPRSSSFIEARKLSEYEKMTYKELLKH